MGHTRRVKGWWWVTLAECDGGWQGVGQVDRPKVGWRSQSPGVESGGPGTLGKCPPPECDGRSGSHSPSVTAVGRASTWWIGRRWVGGLTLRESVSGGSGTLGKCPPPECDGSWESLDLVDRPKVGWRSHSSGVGVWCFRNTRQLSPAGWYTLSRVDVLRPARRIRLTRR